MARYDEGQWPGIGSPIPVMIERVKAWRRAGYDVRIITARVAAPLGLSSDNQWTSARDQQLEILGAWCQEHLGEILPITSQKDPGMLILFDDRAVTVTSNTGEIEHWPVLGDVSAVREALQELQDDEPQDTRRQEPA